MVYRFKDLTNPPPALVDPKWNALRANLLRERDTHEAETKCYRDCTLHELMSLYKDKCAYCERDRGEELQIDHYRPKKSRDNVTDPQYNHPGYYWLTYEWSNLIPLCSKCNNVKSNKFPLTGWTNVNRVASLNNPMGLVPFDPYDRNWLNATELPLLINPEIETIPEKHFIYGRDGRLRFKTELGEETIKICALNRRDLIRIRLKIREGYVNRIKVALDDFGNHRDVAELRGELKGIFKEIRNRCHEDAEFSLFHTYIYRYFSYFIDSKLPIQLRGQALRYFNEFKRRNII